MQKLQPRHYLLHLGRYSLKFPYRWLSISSTAGRSSKGRDKRHVEEEKKVMVDPQEEKCDCVGPPDRLSNLRPVKFYVPPAETSLQQHYRQQRMDTNNWNHRFWAEHNAKYKKMKEEFIKERLEEKYGSDTKERKMLSADEMSEFYKKFLEDHKHAHSQYNREWYKRNIYNLLLSIRVWVEKILHAVK